MQLLRDLQTYVPLTDDVLKYLAHFKISNLLKNIRLKIYRILQGQEFSVSKISLELHPEVTKYFSNLNEHTTYFVSFENEPKTIVTFKKIINLLLMIEKILAEVETTQAVFQYETLVQFNPIQTQIHEAARLILELNIDSSGAEIENSIGIQVIFSDVQNIILDIMDLFQSTATKYIPGEKIVKLNHKLSSILAHLTNKSKMAEHLGFMSGVFVDLLSPEENSHFIGQLISLLPYSLDQLSKQMKLITEHLAAEQSHIPMNRWYELEDNFERIVSSLSSMENTVFSLGSNSISLIYNLRQVYDFCREIVKNIGHLRPQTQNYWKEIIRSLKFEFLPKLVMSIDVLESQLMLKNGMLMDKVWPYIENIYQTITLLVEYLIEFKEEDQDIYWLREPNWNEVYIQLYIKLQTKIASQQKIIEKIIQNFKQWTVSDEPWVLNAEFKANFAVVAPYFARIDAKLHNQILNLITLNDNQEALLSSLAQAANLQTIYALHFSSALSEKITEQKAQVYLAFKTSKSLALVQQALEQDYQQQIFDYSIIVSKIKMLEMHSQKDLSFIVVKKYLNFEHLANSFYGRYAVVMVKKSQQETTTWLWVNKQQKIVETFVPSSFFNALQHRPWIEGVPQKLTWGEIQKVEKHLKKNCDVNFDVSMTWPENLNEETNSNDFYFKYLLTQRALNCCREFFNVLAKVVSKHKFIYYLSEIEQRKLLNAWRGFQHVVEIDLNQTVDQILFDKSKILSVLQERSNGFKIAFSEQFQISYLDYCKNHESQLTFVEREDYFLKTKQLSTSIKTLQKYYSNIFNIYSVKVQKSIKNVSSGIYEDLNTPELILLQPQQVVEQKLVYNILGQLIAFCENLESYQISNFDENYIKLHLDIIINYLNFSNVTFYYFNPQHHLGLLKQLKNIVANPWKMAEMKMAYYGPWEKKSKIKKNNETDALYEWVHRLYSLPPIIQNLNEEIPLTEAQIQMMRGQNAQVASELAEFLSHTNSYWWLFFNIPSISKLLLDIKDKFNEACLSLHQKTIENLYDLKEILFKDILLNCDQIEINSGINPRHLSFQVSLMVDICFENLLKPFGFDIAKFAKLTLKGDLERLRKEALIVSKREITLHKADLQSELEDIEDFEKTFSKHSFKKILPNLVKYNHCRACPNPNELLSEKIIEADKVYLRWIKEICEHDPRLCESISTDGKLPNFDADMYNDIIDLKNHVKNAIKGLIATDLMKITICDEKLARLDKEIETKQKDKAHKIRRIIRDHFDKNTHRMMSGMPFSPDVFNLFKLAFSEHMSERRSQIEEEMYLIVDAQMSEITSIRIEDEAFSGEANLQFYKKMNEAAEIFMQQYYQDYCQLHDLLIQIEAFEQYLEGQQQRIEDKKFVWFESHETLILKACALKNLKELALGDTNISIHQRVEQLKERINHPEFQATVCGYTYVEHWSLAQLTQYFWLLLSYIGFYPLEQEKLYQNLKNECAILPVEPPLLSSYGLFIERDASYQNDFIISVREGLSI